MYVICQGLKLMLLVHEEKTSAEIIKINSTKLFI